MTNLTHLGATVYYTQLGDGSVCLIQIPDTSLQKKGKELGIKIHEAGNYGVGMLFLPQDEKLRKACEEIISNVIAEEEQAELGWRDVPINNKKIAQAAKDVEPVIRQIFIGRGDFTDGQAAFERKLFVIRKRIENLILDLKISDPANFYITSMS